MEESVGQLLLPWISLLVTGFVTWTFYKYFICSLSNKFRIRGLIKKRQKERENSLAKLELRYTNDVKNAKIFQLTEDQLLQDLQCRKLTAVEVLDAFISKAVKATREFNSVTEFLPQAQKWAAKLDAMKDVQGPLHGLPVSIKENIDLEGTDSTKGFGQFIHKPMEDSAVLVKVLLDLGAVPFCKTNVPQSLFTYGCGNPIFGETKNPHRLDLSPGGSSGGEGSLIASGGSIIGIGTDIGGSCRIPAHFCGIAGFKPTMLRLSGVGIRPLVAGIVGLTGGPGILAKNSKLIAKVFKHMTEEERQTKYDLSLIPIPWNEQLFVSKKPLKIGYYTSLPFFPLLGDTEKVVLSAKEALEQRGHSLVPFEFTHDYEIVKLLMQFAYADGGGTLRKIWKDEPVAQAAMLHYFVSNVPKYIRKILASIIGCQWLHGFYSKRMSTFIQHGATKSSDLWDCVKLRRMILGEFLTQWSTLDLDLVLCPAFPFPAVPIKYAGLLKPAVIYTMVWNLFDFPAGVVKFGTESGNNISNYDDEGDFMLRWAKQAASRSKGMPIAVQLVGLPHRDEIVLRGMNELEKVAL